MIFTHHLKIIRRLMRDCYTTTSFSVLVDEELTITFRSQHAYRKDDPTCPFLFNLIKKNHTQNNCKINT